MQNFNPSITSLLKGINLIEASAGTGKTYTIAMLVLRFVVEQNLDIKSILVVTFTKAATEELKDRIRSRLVEARLALNNPDCDHDKSVIEWLASLSIDQTIISERLTHALLDIDQASIFTIHGFCQRVLAEHALESGQLFDSELTGDISSIQQSCCDDFWRKQIYQRTAWEASLLTQHYQTPDQLLASVDHIPAYLTVLPEYEELDQKLIELKQLTKEQTLAITSTLSTIQSALDEGKFKDSFKIQFSSSYQLMLDWLTQKSTVTPDFSIFTQQGLTASLNGQKFRKSKAKPDPADIQKQAYIDSLSIDCSCFELIDSTINGITLILRRSLLHTLQTDISQRLEQLNILSFDDLINRLVDSLQSEKGPSLQQQIQSCYQAALIDEFQDTDKNQWFIFSTLFNSQNHYLYLIGDPKQAIYKFRGADINTYLSAKQSAQHKFSLGSNWRSHPSLVEGINLLFNSENPFHCNDLEFDAVKAALSSEHGSISIGEEKVAPIVLWQLDKSDNEFWTSGKASDEIKSATVNEIINLLSSGFIVQGTDKQTIRPKDIAILVRSNPQAKEFQQQLNQAGITAVINSKASVFSSQDALDCYFLLQAVAQPTDNNLFKQALSLDWFNLNGQQLFGALNDEMVMDAWLSRFLDYQQQWKNKGLMAMMQTLLANEKVLSHLSAVPLAERRITNLQHCIELVQQAAQEEHLGINKTLDWLKTNITQAIDNENTSSDEQQIRLESDEDAVNIITMHSSKGLEYPIVFCPFLWQRGNRLKQEKSIIKCQLNDEMIADLGSDQFEQHRAIALTEELQEDLRVFYVAVTRAKYRCYVNWADVRTKDRANDSAMAYLLNFSMADFASQQSKFQQLASQHSTVFEHRLLNPDQNNIDTWQADISLPQLNSKQRKRPLFSHWQMSSYSALSSLSMHDAAEIPDDKAREENTIKPLVSNYAELPAGPHTGNVIHDLLEHIPFKLLADDTDISVQRDKSCLRYGVKTASPEQIDLLLNHTVSTHLSVSSDSFNLKKIPPQHCLKEMPFYLSMKKLDVREINRILKDSPSYQSLSEKTMRGFLTGFIDLICQHNGMYYLIDYKSNSLESYDHNSLTAAMKHHNYGLQYWIYSLVLHQYLKNKIADYNYQQHFGGVMYLFVRGMDKKQKNSAVYQTKPDFLKIKQLADLFL